MYLELKPHIKSMNVVPVQSPPFWRLPGTAVLQVQLWNLKSGFFFQSKFQKENPQIHLLARSVRILETRFPIFVLFFFNKFCIFYMSKIIFSPPSSSIPLSSSIFLHLPPSLHSPLKDKCFSFNLDGNEATKSKCF